MTEDKRAALISDLSRHSKKDLSDIIATASDELLVECKSLVDSALEIEREGFDRFFESISQTLKYIPNFIAVAITAKYIDPPIAARITTNLPLKNSVQIAKGLKSEYICETAPFLELTYVAELLNALPKKQSQEVTSLLRKRYPAIAREILEILRA